MTPSAKDILNSFAAALAPTTAVATIYIAYRQYRLEQLKLKRELYEKRLAIFNSTVVLLAHIMRHANVDNATLFKFVADTNESYFLLGKDIHDYLWSLYVKGIELQSLREKLYESGLPVGEERTRVAREKAELLIWFGNQFDVARETFAKHLGLDK
jgi:hypothetical protein